MELITDSFMRIGKGHTICEDYAISNSKGEMPYIILADGCSSSKNTDVGARILTHVAAKNVEDVLYQEGEFVVKSMVVVDSFKLKYSCLDSTLMIVKKVKNSDELEILVYGDGSIIIINKDNSMNHIQINYTKNAPYYLSYMTDFKRFTQYPQIEGNKLLITKNGNTREYNSESYPSFYKRLLLSDIKAVLITTDGLDTFMNTYGDCKSSEEVVEELTNFKNTNGAFIQRRCNRMISEFEKEGYYHLDDFSVGGIYIKD